MPADSFASVILVLVCEGFVNANASFEFTFTLMLSDWHFTLLARSTLTIVSLVSPCTTASNCSRVTAE
jgi:hypothetical protein